MRLTGGLRELREHGLIQDGGREYRINGIFL
jgi:hypothetical protein